MPKIRITKAPPRGVAHCDVPRRAMKAMVGLTVDGATVDEMRGDCIVSLTGMIAAMTPRMRSRWVRLGLTANDLLGPIRIPRDCIQVVG